VRPAARRPAQSRDRFAPAGPQAGPFAGEPWGLRVPPSSRSTTPTSSSSTSHRPQGTTRLREFVDERWGDAPPRTRKKVRAVLIVLHVSTGRVQAQGQPCRPDPLAAPPRRRARALLRRGRRKHRRRRGRDARQEDARRPLHVRHRVLSRDRRHVRDDSSSSATHTSARPRTSTSRGRRPTWSRSSTRSGANSTSLVRLARGSPNRRGAQRRGWGSAIWARGPAVTERSPEPACGNVT